MVRTPAVSVIMPAFNAERTIATAVQSVIEQTLDSLELIVCDDASTDGTLEVLQGLSDSRIRILSNSSNLGAGPSRDRAISHARAPLIAFLDADDAWQPERLTSLVACSVRWPGHLIFDDLMLCHETSRGMVPWRRLHGSHAFGFSDGESSAVPLETYVTSDRLLIKPLLPTSAVKSTAITHSTRRFAEDAEYFIRLGLGGVPFRYVPRPLYLYRIAPFSLTAQASGSGHMQACIDELAGTPGISASFKDALRRKSKAIAQDDAIRRIAAAIPKGRFRDMIATFRSSQGLIRRLLRRAPSRIHYEVHRLLSRGIRR